ncbi:MAG: hypothetical protein AAGI28_05205 [Pseudomonadota bacterium]
MFEKAKPPTIPHAADFVAREAPNIDAASGPSHGGEAIPLRTVEWGELTTRLRAARDLRELLREDVTAKIGSAKAGFAQAAAQFFRTNEEDERRVNPNALEGRKASSGIQQRIERGQFKLETSADQESTESSAATRCEPGDAREEQ